LLVYYLPMIEFPGVFAVTREKSPHRIKYSKLSLVNLDDILAIEKASFTMPWTRRMFVDSLRDEDVGFHYGAWVDGRLKGYVIAWRIVDELHIGNFAVDPKLRRQGIGEGLLRFVIDNFFSRAGRLVTLEVRVSNKPAITLYHKLGFRDVAVRFNYYSDNNEDALVMILEAAD